MRKENDMAKNKTPGPAVRPRTAETGEDDSAAIKPLTRRGYKRLAATEKQIAATHMLEEKAMLARAQCRDDESSDYLSPEALVYFIRRADRNEQKTLWNGLFRELFERCTPFFRGQFRGFDKTTREDLQQDVLKKVVEDILAPDDRADFMEVRFWSYLKRRTIDACNSALAHTDDLESLDSGYRDEGDSGGRTRLELETDKRLGPEELVMVSEGLAKLPPKLRRVFVLRHAVGMAIGPDNPNDDPPDELTLAHHFGCSGRTIRNWLRQADELLAGLKEKENDDGE